MTLNYRSPDTPELRAKQMLNDLFNEKSFDWVIALAKLVFSWGRRFASSLRRCGD